MKTHTKILFVLLTAALLLGCNGVNSLIQQAGDAEAITPSDVIIKEERTVTGFSAIEMGAIGILNITQGEGHSLLIEGSDNIVPLIQTSVRNGKLFIEMEKNIVLRDLDSVHQLTFTISVEDLTELTVSGMGKANMESLNTTQLDLVVSGAGDTAINHISADRLNITVSGMGNVELAGSAGHAKIEIPGGGEVKAGDLECQSAEVNISGLGNVTVWVIDQLSGTISGGGSVSYYGNPRTNTNTTGLGKFESLGNK